MSIDVSNINNPLSQYITSSTKETADQNAFEAILNEAVEKKDSVKLKKACQEFEGYYLQQLFKEMRKTIPDSGLLEKSQGRDIFEDMLYEEYSKNMSKGKGMGLSEMLYRQLSKNITD
ncbi:MAG: flagellar biosynthesis protein FlgJ [Firmicutes bacterium HGW-Firmicutes-1]|nr:MAG: flagellar biosynthesis protein FlgJ [Firmicutes bacterium HGW-Firmicutes-1]